MRWEPIPTPELIVGPEKVARQVRYVALNPTRAGYVDDPLSWLWSTYREGFGAVSDAWVPLERVVPIFGGSTCELVVPRMHKYVSSDPSVHVRGSALPSVAKPSAIARVPLERIAAAACAAYRAPLDAIRRQRSEAREAFFALAAASGWRNPNAVAIAAGASQRTARRGFDPEIVIDPACWVCLGDARFTLPLTNPSRATRRQISRVSLP